jgi:hypothetical protein
VRDVPSGEAFIRAERAKLGPLRPNQRRVLFVFAMMVASSQLPAVAGLDGRRSGCDDDLAQPRAQCLGHSARRDVPPVCVPFGGRSVNGLLTWKDAERESPWNAMLLVTGAVAMTDALAQFGFVEFMGNIVRNLGHHAHGAALCRCVEHRGDDEFHVGTRDRGAVLQLLHSGGGADWLQPASIAILIANVALGMVVPWAGATAVTTFTAGENRNERHDSRRHRCRPPIYTHDRRHHSPYEWREFCRYQVSGHTRYQAWSGISYQVSG